LIVVYSCKTARHQLGVHAACAARPAHRAESTVQAGYGIRNQDQDQDNGTSPHQAMTDTTSSPQLCPVAVHGNTSQSPQEQEPHRARAIRTQPHLISHVHRQRAMAQPQFPQEPYPNPSPINPLPHHLHLPALSPLYHCTQSLAWTQDQGHHSSIPPPLTEAGIQNQPKPMP
jgi:hypothetical protein